MNELTRKVLVVEDDPGSLRILVKFLEQSNYVVTQATCAQGALEAIEVDCPDFLITDWEMPGMDGLHLCRRVRTLDLPTYVYQVIVSARGSSRDIVQGLEAGADDFLPKPIHREELLARLRAGARVIDRERRLSLLARSDPLTGLPTKRALHDVLTKEWARARRYRTPLSCVIMDVDYFKQINDTHGHPAGDVVLKKLAQTLSERCRVSDTVCRYGGEEFVVILPETEEENASLWAERQRRFIADLQFPLGDEQVGVTCSFGVAEVTHDVDTPEKLIELADRALLAAKQSGRDRVVSYSVVERQMRGLEATDLTRPLEGVKALDVMTSIVATFRSDETLAQAAGHFLRSRTSSAPVVDDDGLLIGVISEKDLLGVMLSPHAWSQPIRKTMKTHVVSYEADTPIQTIYEFLCRVAIRQAFVVADGRPVGIISRECLVRWFTSWVEVHTDLLGSGGKKGADSSGDAVAWRRQINSLARDLGDRAIRLEHELREADGDLVPKLVSGASQIEGLLSDLLSYTRFANEQSALEPSALESAAPDR